MDSKFLINSGSISIQVGSRRNSLRQTSANAPVPAPNSTTLELAPPDSYLIQVRLRVFSPHQGCIPLAPLRHLLILVYLNILFETLIEGRLCEFFYHSSPEYSARLTLLADYYQILQGPRPVEQTRIQNAIAPKPMLQAHFA